MKTIKNLATILVVLTMTFSYAQENSFGITAGYTSAAFTFGDESDSAGGFAVGAFGEFEFHGQFSVMPQIIYTSVKNGDMEESADFIMIPILAKFNLSDKVGIMAGPQMNFSLNDDREDVKKTNFAIDLGLKYDITDKIFVQGNYAIALTEPVEDSKVNFFYFSVGYKL